MSSKPAKPIEQIKAAQNGSCPLGTSELYRWMWEHFEELRGDQRGRRNWVAATSYYAHLGLTDASGAPLKPWNVRRVWGRVLRDKLGRHDEAEPSAVPVVRSAPPLPSPAQTTEPAAFEFRTLRKTPLRKQE